MLIMFFKNDEKFQWFLYFLTLCEKIKVFFVSGNIKITLNCLPNFSLATVNSPKNFMLQKAKIFGVLAIPKVFLHKLRNNCTLGNFDLEKKYFYVSFSSHLKEKLSTIC